MKLVLTDRFRRAYAELSSEDRKRVQKALRFMSDDLRHPSLRVKRIQGTQGIWEARASRSLRITFQFNNDIILRNVGRHDQTLSKP
jgi:mRNA interferase RelE/StbE